MIQRKVSMQARTSKPATIWEVAKQLDLSAASVSRALNKKPGVSKQTAEKVRRVADALGYVASTSARTLVTGSSRTLGLVVADIVNPFFSELLREFEHQAEQQSYQVVLVTIDNDRSRVRQSIQRLLERKVDGIAVMMIGQSPMRAELLKRGVPTVFLQGERRAATISNINLDVLRGIEQAIDHLRRLGHKRLAYIGPNLSQLASRIRFEAIKSVSAGLLAPDAAFLGYEPTLQGGFDGMSDFLTRKNKITAVMMFNDIMAHGALRACSMQNVHVPRDLSVIGFDDVEISKYVSPPLTTVCFSRVQLASVAVSTLVEMIRTTSRGKTFMMDTELVERESTGVANKF